MQLKADCLKQIGSNWHSDWTSVLVIYGATSSLMDHHILQSRYLASSNCCSFAPEMKGTYRSNILDFLQQLQEWTSPLSKVFSRNGWNKIGIQLECDQSEQILTYHASIVGPSYPSIWQVRAVSHLFQKSMKRNVSFQYIGFPSVTSRVDTTIEEIF
jgi:hypothetical protein